MAFTIEHRSIAGAVLGTTTPAEIEWEHMLNEPATVDYQLHITEPLATYTNVRPYKTDFMLWRKGVDFMGGMHTLANIPRGDRENLHISGKNWLHYLERRRYPFNPNDLDQYLRNPNDAPVIRWVSTDIFRIVEDMLDETLALNNSLDLLYNNGLSGYTQHFDFPLADMASLLSHIADLAGQAPGFDYDVLPNKTFMMWAPRRGLTTPTFTFSLNPGGTVDDWDYENLGIAGTRLIGFGAGHGGDRLPVLRQNLAVEANYRNFSATEDFGSTRDRDRLAAKTQKALNIASMEQIGFSLVFKETNCDIVLGGVELGDNIYVNGDTGYQVFVNKEMRVVGMRGSETRDGEETVELVVDPNI